jgi:uncharacterized protein (TIGR00730 family)
MAAMTRLSRPPAMDPQLVEAMDSLIRKAGGDPDSPLGMRGREILHTALKLLRDGADDGEIKLISRSLKELRYALKVFRPYHEARKVTIFGSARTPPDHPDYVACVDFSKRIAERGWMVITGAGDGIMRAGHGGAGADKSFGVAIRLPFETNANDYIVGDPKLITFRYFFTRKLMFMWQAHAVVMFPGGFGTQDETFEALTLVQTGKAPMTPIVLVDRPGGEYWNHWDRYVRSQLLDEKLISPEDLNLYMVTDDAQTAVDHVLHFYRNYHSMRFVRDLLLIRMQRRLTDAQVQAINAEFRTLVKEGAIEQGGPHEHEQEFAELPRLRFVHTKRAYGKLRLLIDRINDFDAENNPDVDIASSGAARAQEDFADQTASFGDDGEDVE